MSITADAQCFLLIVGFRNVGMIRTGLYKLRVDVSYSQGEMAVPVDMIAGIYYKQLNLPRLNLGVSTILEEQKVYISNSFLIEQPNDYAKIGDVCKFKMNLNVSPGLNSTPLIISLRLLYCPTFSRVYHGNPDIPSDPCFSEESIVRISVSKPLCGVHEYFQATFDDFYCSTLDFVVHTSVAHFTFSADANKGLFPNLTPAGAQQSDLATVFDNYAIPHACHLQRMQDIVAEIRPSIRGFDENIAVRLSQSVVFAGPRAHSDVSLQYWQFYFQHSYGCNEENSIAWIDYILDMISRYSQELFELLFSLSVTVPSTLLIYFHGKFIARQVTLYENAIFKEKHMVDCIPLESNNEIGETHAMMAKARRLGQHLSTDLSQLDDAVTPLFSIDTLPILFEDSYASPNLPIPQPQCRSGYHLIVLVHGYDGTSNDLLCMRNYLAKKYYENTVFMCSKANEGLTKGDIFDMGRRLAREIHIAADEIRSQPLKKLSLIGYSLGGLIARAALLELGDWSDKMHAFVSLSSPHLGLMYMSSSLVDAGLWFIKSWTKANCLKQLAMTDKSNIPDTALYRLSQHEGLSWFQHVVLFSSAQDMYSPLESSRIELSKKAQNGSDKGCYFVEMAWNLIAKLRPENVRRVDVNFAADKLSIDVLIGRMAHTEFIESKPFFQILAEISADLFA